MSVTPSKIFTVACISFIAGIFVCSLIPISIFYAAMLIFLAVLFLVGTFPLHAKWGAKVWLLPSLGIFVFVQYASAPGQECNERIAFSRSRSFKSDFIRR